MHAYIEQFADMNQVCSVTYTNLTKILSYPA